MNWILFALLIVASYLLGSVPFGLVYARLRGVDIRKVGSGNIGATNVSRQFGFLGGFVPVFLLDFLKGALPVIAARFLPALPIPTDVVMICAGMAAMLGHIFPIYLGFKGGKGVATAGGMVMAFAPLECSLCLLVFALMVLIARALMMIFGNEPEKGIKVYFKTLQKSVGISSVTAAIALPVFTLIFNRESIVLIVLSFLVTVIIVYSHRKNLAELFGFSKKS